jgi:hypothetical protein
LVKANSGDEEGEPWRWSGVAGIVAREAAWMFDFAWALLGA